ncbi:Hermansky-Pudlak syndrome 1 protein homolog [Agrilus planipennis]|uniref:Hermansky-Pudlak syndrome 1 protein homolog n=1 Tax=Agrilus planipennis TaxID=224129 RepID=A0A1W4XCB7_AGRPL|nr:Hermansky-Pudlak syndrome 1 protein homolog [Agrilus planipennis]
MKCILIFNALNDVIFLKYNKGFLNHINTYAKTQGLMPEKCAEMEDEEEVSLNVIVQIFSPLITSHRVMNCEFSNTYDSIECGEGIKLVFKECMGHLFVAISKDTIFSIKTWQRWCIGIVKFVCCMNIDLLRNKSYYSKLAGSLLECWENISNVDQSLKLEAVEQLIINSDLRSATLVILKDTVEQIKLRKAHALILVQNKLLSLYSSQNASELSSADLLLLILLNNAKKTELTTPPMLSETQMSLSESCFSQNSNSCSLSTQTELENIYSFYVFLTGYKPDPTCVPHVVHFIPITEEICLTILIESPRVSSTCIATYDTFIHLNVLQNLQNQRNFEMMKLAMHNLEVAVNILNTKLKNLKAQKVEINHKMITSRWKATKKAYDDFLKYGSDEAFMKSELALGNFADVLKKLFDAIGFDYDLVNSTKKTLKDATDVVRERLMPFNDMFRVKALKNFSLGSYLEQFPGLVHFVYIDRTSHRVVAPGLDISVNDDANEEFKKEVWQMIQFCQKHLQEGYLSLLWKNLTFKFAYFLWFEDVTGEVLKPVNASEAINKISKPGIINGDFYYKLKQSCFPKLSPNKVRCYELYSVHLKIVAPSLILDHMKKLTTTIWEIKGHSNNPIDLL